MTQENLADELNTESDELQGAGRIKAVALINMTFDLLSYFVEDGEDREGNPKTSYVGEIILDGVRCQAWLNGWRVQQQVRLAKERGAFPCKVRWMVNTDKSYQLKFLATNLIDAEPSDGFE